MSGVVVLSPLSLGPCWLRRPIAGCDAEARSRGAGADPIAGEDAAVELDATPSAGAGAGAGAGAPVVMARACVGGVGASVVPVAARFVLGSTPEPSLGDAACRSSVRRFR